VSSYGWFVIASAVGIVLGLVPFLYPNEPGYPHASTWEGVSTGVGVVLGVITWLAARKSCGD
jgi:hypothetical protein